MSVKDKLQIYLITYNRKNKLVYTLNELLKSPVKDYDITVLDNASTDGTSEILDEYANEYKNITHIRHTVNIGGNANISRAFEMAASCGKEYFWVLCDDDKYDFTNWTEVEDAMKKSYDLVLVERKINFPKDKKWEYIMNTSTFVPSIIYKTAIVTSQVLQNAYSNLYTGFPHLACSCNALNNDCTYWVGPNIVHQDVCIEFKRGTNEDIHYRQAHCNLFAGYINSYNMIKDKNMRKSCCNVLWIGKSFYYSMRAFWRENKFFAYNITDIYNGISFEQKLQFLLAGLFELFATFIFSIRKSSDKSHFIVTVLGFKLKLSRQKIKL